MRFDKPAGDNVADRQKVLGQPWQRIDGPLKTTGTAPYAYERHDVARGQLVGYPVGAAIAKGRITSMDTRAAKASPGVVAVITTLDMDRLPKGPMNVAYLFGGDEVQHYHQAIAVVVAETFEQARAAAALIRTDYDEDKSAHFDLAERYRVHRDDEVEPMARVGDFDSAYAGAPAKIDATYTTPGQCHAQMEPHASIAEWKDGQLTLWTANQMIEWSKKALAKAFDLPADKVRLDSPYIGGGFGAKLFLRADAVLAVAAARATGRPVKVALPRPMIANNATHRAQTIQRIRIATDADGRILAIGHDNTSNTLPGGDGENGAAPTEHFYAGENRLLRDQPLEMHLPESNAMRAPGEAAGLMALEVAMDEMAEQLDMDPVEFRVLNDTQVDPGKPERRFSERHFVECLQQGADEFGWSERNRKPGQRRDGAWLIGHGVAGAYRGAPAQASGARVALKPDGRVRVDTDMTDIGTGSYTIIAQTAAEMLGVAVDAVEVGLGDSDAPVSAGSGGQWGAASATAGVYAACVVLRERIAERLGADPATLEFVDGQVRHGGENTPLAGLAGDRELVAEDQIEFGDFRDKDYVLATFGAHFVEVGVHAYTGEIRVRRMLAVCDAGRILNPITARSQVIGGMTMGVGAALMEELKVDTRRGFFATHDLASYEVPVHADIPEQTVIFLQGEDRYSSPLKAKGVGELGICGVSAAVANAVYNATGVRVRDYPITLDKFLDQLPRPA
ncbi:aldehyde oxidoreductase molybdenum-binding subunit PaoC [Alloalcanivorax sp. C16-1]|uniref:aldehyde oxidoreductase molybdenum-binding subunit PaoC n=1 Tax=Alloalcanivorax sp. C16-1 TaxID=3390051 RepID=UPI00397052F8